MFYLILLLCFIGTILLTPIVKKLAVAIGATDKPNKRKVHQGIMPRMGGLAIFISFVIGVILLPVEQKFTTAFLVGCTIIIITGMLDDMLELSAKLKLLGQLAAAVIVIVWGGVQITFINLPFGGEIQFGIFSIPLTIIWIVGVTNAINLIDGLDGLAAGVSSIALIVIGGMAFIMGDIYVAMIGAVLLVSTLGFLLYNFHPAKIFMGDTGALFLGYAIAVLSLLGYKNLTFISLIVPVIILGVPISDTFFAIIRRLVNKQPLSAADKSHLHHCLLRIGFTHRQAVLAIYGIAALFGLAAVIFSVSTVWGSLIVVAVLLLAIEIMVESIGLVGKNYRPILNYIRARNRG